MTAILEYWEEQHIRNEVAKLSGNGGNTLDILDAQAAFGVARVMLNIGVGFGTFEAYCVNHGKTIDAMDIADNAGDKVEGIARNFYRRADLLPPNEYDLITECQVALHLSDDEMESHIQHAIRAIKPDGLYAFNAPDWIDYYDPRAATVTRGDVDPGHQWAGYMCRTPNWYAYTIDKHGGRLISSNPGERIEKANKQVYVYHVARKQNAD